MKHYFPQKNLYQKGSIKIIKKTVTYIIEVVHIYIQKCSNKCGNSSTCRIDCLQWNFLQCLRITVKSGGTKFPTLSYHPDKFGCHRFCGSVDIKFSVFQATTWQHDLVDGVQLTWVTTLPRFGAMGDVKVQI